nr:peptidase dimerization domain-containing protein [Gammaproteobacteria bacterium]
MKTKPRAAERHPRIHAPRLVERLKEMANIGRTPTPWRSPIMTASASKTRSNSIRFPLLAACAAVQSMDRFSASLSDDSRFTVGRLDVLPNSPNTIAGEVSFTIDLRSPKESELDVLETEIRRTITNLALESEVNRTLSLSSIDFDREIRNITQ